MSLVDGAVSSSAGGERAGGVFELTSAADSVDSANRSHSSGLESEGRLSRTAMSVNSGAMSPTQKGMIKCFMYTFITVVSY